MIKNIKVTLCVISATAEIERGSFLFRHESSWLINCWWSGDFWTFLAELFLYKTDLHFQYIRDPVAENRLFFSHRSQMKYYKNCLPGNWREKKKKKKYTQAQSTVHSTRHLHYTPKKINVQNRTLSHALTPTRKESCVHGRTGMRRRYVSIPGLSRYC